MVEKLFRRRAPTPESTVLDPGCGEGEFIEGVLRWCTRESVAVPNILGSAAPIAATWLQAHVSGANWLNVATAVLLCLISMAAICASPETLARSAT